MSLMKKAAKAVKNTVKKLSKKEREMMKRRKDFEERQAYFMENLKELELKCGLKLEAKLIVQQQTVATGQMQSGLALTEMREGSLQENFNHYTQELADREKRAKERKDALMGVTPPKK